VTSLTLLPLLGPLSYLLASLVARADRGPRPSAALRALRAAALLGLAGAAATALITALAGPLTSPLLGAAGLGFSVRLDGLSAVMLGLVAALGAAVVEFSRNYLDGDER
jgi:NAD(P)H-quinone oxidoreductase subunit 5